MNNIDKFNETVSILVKAYLDDTLAHGSCAACAVGNIIGAKTGRKPVEDFGSTTGFDNYNWNTGERTQWFEVFSTCEGKQRIERHLYRGLAKIEIDASGYTLDELIKIEYAFESAEKPKGWRASDKYSFKDDVWMFNGLMAVVDVLAEIHGINLEQKESAKSMFVK